MPKKKPKRARDGTLVPDSWAPNRKWWAGLVGAASLNLLALVGVDVGQIGVSLAEAVGYSVDEQSVEATSRSVIGYAAGTYLWPEWRSLPVEVRKLASSTLRKLKRAKRS